MESCTLLVLGSQYGIQILDWNGAVLIHEMDFAQHGIGADEKQVREGKFGSERSSRSHLH